MTQLLVSVRDEHEALSAAEAGADLIDMKEPRAGALGALGFDAVERIAARLREHAPGRRLSATVGDPLPPTAANVAATLARVRRMAACGVDDVKVGIAADGAPLIDALAAGRWGTATIVPVLIADDGVAPALLARACAGPFAALMLDTFDKRGGSLIERRSEAELRGFVEAVRSSGKLCGLAGSLRTADLPVLRRLGADFAGFRGAVCDGDRAHALDPRRVAALKAALPAGARFSAASPA
ncbi:MAG TPA: (5-formylfuran-3-yl)methyl phosphate synthase [Methylibium sp.]|uniref:(5-formylfuran-3-yl)methyl phosphate synthase n=1 Tax=Methylibium sp. TaxID=2067992 RepID=UPI002DB9AB4E|nr:(5-formylfuran-3-yl)methyl phosphate synthase [Methylibium sp.]HEU4459800.1 (5-formylfuran-3-yl)methyl phosphate synthase [Methylibium sp.]